MRNFKTTLLLFGFVLAVSLIFVRTSPASAAASLCYVQNAQTQKPESLPICDHDKLGASGFNVDGLPNPLDPSACYYFTSDVTAPGRVVDCSDTQFAGAAPIGTDTSSTPPPASLDAATAAAQSAQDKIDAGNQTFDNTQCDGKNVDPNNNCIINDINTLINVMSAGVGVLVIITIISAGIQYITAGGDPQKVSKSKDRIRNAVFALVAFALLFAFLQWIVPGGILG